MSIFDDLAAPFPPEEIHWRAQQVYEKNGQFSALALAYIDARNAMDRLDQVVGPNGWSDYMDETPSGRVICKLSILIGDEWVTKSDGAGSTAMEGDKGGISDAFKRAGVKWGIGRYLYGLGNTYAPCEVVMTKEGDNWVPRKNQNGKPIFKKWKPEAQQIFRDALAGISQEPNRETNRKLQGPHKSITSLEAAIRKIAPQFDDVGTWDDWRGPKGLYTTNEALFQQAERDHPDWFFGWKGMPGNFVPLKERIEKLDNEFKQKEAA